MMRQVQLLAFVLLVAAAFGGCGLKGDLYLPEDGQQEGQP